MNCNTSTFEELCGRGAIKINSLKDNELIDISNDFPDCAKLRFDIKKLIVRKVNVINQHLKQIIIY